LDQKHGWNKKRRETHTKKRRKRLKQQARNYKPVLPSLKAPKKCMGRLKKHTASEVQKDGRKKPYLRLMMKKPAEKREALREKLETNKTKEWMSGLI